ncbi:MAG: sigma-54-dependent Fis family transcriptional regulator [Alphaproteobacteria bacterium]|nr:MAG: sigma-54-dependent Fis family transcriptional regulator [Alphaproteobacteria bacterium]
MDGTVILADDDRTIRTVLTQALTRAGCRVHATGSLTTLMRWIEEGRGDLVITDVILPEGNGLEAIPRIHELRPDLPVIVISAQNTITTAIEAERVQAWDYLPKPFDLPDLMKRVSRALAARGRRPAPAAPRAAEALAELPLIGRTDPMQQLYRMLARVLNADLPVLVTGESGAGKTLVARILHDHSDRRGRPLLVVEPEDLLAAEGPAALAARARGGTLLIEEIADLPDPAQARLARLIDTLGGEGAPRVVATTQADPEEALAAGRLRQDLFYRLEGVRLEVPPLRQRLDDLPLLAEALLAEGAAGGELPARRLSAEALALMRRYSWPGNVRQLANVLRRAAALGRGPEITAAEMQSALAAEPRARREALRARGGLSETVAEELRAYFAAHGDLLPPPGVWHRVRAEVERPLIEIALEATGGNQQRCAELLGVNRNTLRKRIRELQIQVTRRRNLV